MREAELVVRGRRVVLPEGIRPASVVVRRGRIAELAPFDAPPAAAARLEAGELVVMPGLVDTHVHVDEPGRTEWEGFETATDAAAAGGVTTLVDMPLNSDPVTTTPAALEAKLRALDGRCRVDVGVWGGLVPGNLAELEPLLEAGVLGFKAFLVPSGIDDFPAVGEEELRGAMRLLAGRGVPLLVHAELPGPIAAAAGAASRLDRRSHAAWLASRPPEAEVRAIELVIRLCRETGCRAHVVHLSAAAALEPLAAARAEGLPLTVETCPHYLVFAAGEIPDGGTPFKCAPPIRGAAGRERLWAALAEGTIDMVASDHSPCPPAMKRLADGDFIAAWGGIASLELALPAVWTEARRRGFPPERVAAWMGESPARLAGLDGRKGRIAPGHDADLVLWDPDASFTVEPAALRQRHPITPYAGRTLHGRVREVVARGRSVLRGGVPTGERGGAWLPRPGTRAAADEPAPGGDASPRSAAV